MNCRQGSSLVRFSLQLRGQTDSRLALRLRRAGVLVCNATVDFVERFSNRNASCRFNDRVSRHA
jgi:hypothetical protein